MPYRNVQNYHHIDYLLFGTAFGLNQVHGHLYGFGTIASGVLAVAAGVRAITELVKMIRSAHDYAHAGSPPGAPPFPSLCPFADFCREYGARLTTDLPTAPDPAPRGAP